MRRFRFRLEAARRLRQLAEERAQAELAAALRARAAEEAALGDVRRQRSDAVARRRALVRGSLDVGALVAADLLDNHLALLVEAHQARVVAARAAVEDGIAALRDRHAEREALERLREEQREDHRMRELSGEQQSLDEGAVLRRRPSGSGEPR